MGDTHDSAAIFQQESRFWVQRVMVPILVCIGAAGNTVSIIVLTRRRMRSSTNVYLTALAVADVIYLFFVLLLSFEHYPNINDGKYELYWRFYGISHWLCDVASSTSVWLTVSFTIERYIVVCHPIKGKILCTEGRAKSIIAIVSVLCFLTTATTPFEYQLAVKQDCIKLCDESELKSLHLKQENEIHQSLELKQNKTLDSSPSSLNLSETQNCSQVNYYENSYENNVPVNEESLSYFINSTQKLIEAVINIMFLNATCCLKNYTVETEATSLGNDNTYRGVFYWFSAIGFGILPLTLIATFNCFLVHAVFQSHKTRKIMTNSQENKSQSQENRITILLIAVVVLFLICQIPTASVLMFVVLVDNKDVRTNRILAGLGNIFNMLVTLNASCNFILYCVLSDKYRQTFYAVFFKRQLKLNREDTASLRGSRYLLRSSKKKIIKRGNSEYATTPRNLETQSLNSIPRSQSLMQRPLGKAKTSDLNI